MRRIWCVFFWRMRERHGTRMTFRMVNLPRGVIYYAYGLVVLACRLYLQKNISLPAKHEFSIRKFLAYSSCPTMPPSPIERDPLLTEPSRLLSSQYTEDPTNWPSTSVTSVVGSEEERSALQFNELKLFFSLLVDSIPGK